MGPKTNPDGKVSNNGTCATLPWALGVFLGTDHSL